MNNLEKLAKYTSFINKVESEIGDLYCASNGDSIIAIYFQKEFESSFDSYIHLYKHVDFSANALLKQLSQELKSYFKKESKIFTVPLKLYGTDFQVKCWSSLVNIGYGSTISYSDFASKYLKSEQLRAFSGAIGKNPIPIVLPCHRVVGKNGSLTGFSGGLDIKSYLLMLEI